MMQSRTISSLIFLLIVESCYSNFIQEIQLHIQPKLNSDNECAVIKCVGEGTTCVPEGKGDLGCNACESSFNECMALASNSSGYCQCYSSYVDCVDVLKSFYCPASELHDSCKTMFKDCSCGNSASYSYTVDVCSMDLRCDENSSKCMKKSGVGESCYSDNDCGGHYTFVGSKEYNCNDTINQCYVQSGWASPNDGCSSNADCHNGGSFVACLSGVCNGKNRGESCSDSKDCDFGYYCSGNKVCSTTLKEGVACATGADSPCAHGLICGHEGTCIKLFSKDVGMACLHTEECKMGLFCNDTSDKCQKSPEPKSCETDQDCLGIGNEQCECKYDGTKQCSLDDTGLDSSCQEHMVALVGCAEENKCKSFTVAEESCVMRNCKKESNCYLKCQLTSYQRSLGAQGCFKIPECEDVPGSSTKLSISLFLTLLGILTLLL